MNTQSETESVAGPRNDRLKRRSPRRIDWRQAAHMIAEGKSPATVAAGLGIPEERVWRHLETSAHFRGLIRHAASRWQRLAAMLDDGAAPGGGHAAPFP